MPGRRVRSSSDVRGGGRYHEIRNEGIGLGEDVNEKTGHTEDEGQEHQQEEAGLEPGPRVCVT